MNDTLIEFLRILAQDARITVGARTRRAGVLSLELGDAVNRATLVCNAEAPPVASGGQGVERYGAYVIMADGYGDWVKGDDARECATYVASWFCGLAARNGIAGQEIVLPALSDGPEEMSSFELGELANELRNRASLKFIVSDPALLRSEDGNVELELRRSRTGIVGSTLGRLFRIKSGTVGVQAAAVTGFLDGLSENSDE